MAKSISKLVDTKKQKKKEDPTRRAMAETLYQEAMALSDSRFKKMQLEVYRIIMK
jgi:phosphodiesterase/alkaline phosphatase D-like protein